MGMAVARVRAIRELARRRHAWTMGGDPDTERAGSDHELERSGEVDCLAVDAGMNRRCRLYLEPGGGPGPRGRIGARVWRVEDDDSSRPLSSVGRVPVTSGRLSA